MKTTQNPNNQMRRALTKTSKQTTAKKTKKTKATPNLEKKICLRSYVTIAIDRNALIFANRTAKGAFIFNVRIK